MQDNQKAFFRVREVVSILTIFIICGCYSFFIDESFKFYH